MKKVVAFALCCLVALCFLPCSALAAEVANPTVDPGNPDVTFAEDIMDFPEVILDEYLMDVAAVVQCARVTSGTNNAIQLEKVLYQREYAKYPLENTCYAMTADGALKSYLGVSLDKAPAKAKRLVLILKTLPSSQGALPTVEAIMDVDAAGKLTQLTKTWQMDQYNGKKCAAFFTEITQAAKKNEAVLVNRITSADAVALLTVRSVKSGIATLEANRLYKGKNGPFSVTVPAANRTVGERVLGFLRYNRAGKQYIPIAERGIVSSGDPDFYYILARLDKRSLVSYSVPSLPEFGSVLGYATEQSAAIGALDRRFAKDASAPICDQTRLTYEWKCFLNAVGTAWLDPQAFALFYRFADEQSALAARNWLRKNPVYQGSQDVIPVPAGGKVSFDVGTPLALWFIKGNVIVCVQKGSKSGNKMLQTVCTLLSAQGYQTLE